MSNWLPAKTPEGEDVMKLAQATEAPAAGYVPPETDDDEKGVDPRRYLAAVLRYKWLVLGLTMVGAAAGAVLSRNQRPVYEAQATIWVESGAMSAGPITTGRLLQNTNWLDLLRSYTVLDSVVRQERLFISAAQADSAVTASLDIKDRFRPGRYELKVDESGRNFTLELEGAGPVQQGVVGDSVGNVVGLTWVPPIGELTPGRVVPFRVTTPRQAAIDVDARLISRIPIRDGNFIRMTLTGSSPSKTAGTLNAIAEQFVRVAAELKSEKHRQFRQILEQQLQTSATELRRAELALEGFRVNTITEPSEQTGAPVAAGLQTTQNTALSSFFAMRTQADNLRQDREAIERVMRMGLDTGVSMVMLEAIPSVQSASELMTTLRDLTTKEANRRALLTQYHPTYEPVARLTAEIATLKRQTIPGLLQTLQSEIRTRERELEGRLATASRDLRQIPTRSIEEARLSRQMAIASNLYTDLQGRYSEARLAEASSVPDVRVLDAAVVPDRPKQNPTPLFLFGGIAGGFALAIATALLLDRFDRRVRYPDQVTRELGLAILGVVPRVRTNNGDGGLKGDGAQQVIEALRTIRLNLVHAYGSAGPLITAITSPGSGDGKSFVASNLALAFADAGHRTLLIDADIRRGALHRTLDAQRKPGLLDCLAGNVSRTDIVQQTRIAHLDFIGCGTRKIGGPELLASSAMSQLLLSLRSQYSVIILDTAPLGAGVDPLVLGTLTGSLMLIMRTGVTDRELTQAKLGDLYRLPIRILGAVLNDVKPEGIYRYYSYLPGYASEDEVEEDTRGKRLKIKAGK